MSGHHKFSQLTEQFSEKRQDEISQKTTQLKAKIDLTLEEREKGLLEMSDEEIDYSDIPPLDEKLFQNAKLVKRKSNTE